MTVEARLADGRVLKFPDGTDPAVIQLTVKKMTAQAQPEPQPQQNSVDVGQEMPQQDDTVSRLGIPRTLGGEQALGTIATGALAEPVAGLAGLAQSLNPLAEEGAGARAVQSTRDALTFKPDNPEAISNLQSLAETAEPVTSALTATEKGLGDFAFELTGSPTIAAGAATIPTAILEALGLAGIKKLRTGTRLIDDAGQPTKALRRQLDKNGLVFENMTPEAKASIPSFADKKFIPGKSEVASSTELAIIEQIKSGGKDNALASLKVVGNRIEPDRIAIEAVRQGYSEGFVQSVKVANKETRSGMKEMLSMMRRIKKNDRLGLDIRPTDVVGDSFVKRLGYIRDSANKARNELDSIAKTQLTGKQINTAPIVDKLGDALDKLDVRLVDDPTGIPRANFEGSLISKDRSSQRVIKDLVDLMAEGVTPDALRFHKLKRQLDTMIDYRKVSTTGLTPSGKKVLMAVRTELNKSLRAISPDYARVNDVLHKSLTAIEDFQKVSGPSIDILGTNANKAIGQDLRGLMSNRKSRVRLEDAIEQVENITKDLGGVFKDDLKGLSQFANGLDNRFGAVAKSSFKGEIESAIKQTAQQGAKATAVQKAAETAGKAGDKLRGINDFNAFEAMTKLLNEK